MIVGQAATDLLARIENAIDHVSAEYENVSCAELLGALRQAARKLEDAWLEGPTDNDGPRDDEATP